MRHFDRRSLRVDDIVSEDVPGKSRILPIHNVESYPIWIPDSTHGDIELPMTKAGLWQVDAHPLEGLPLTFVDGHGEGKLDWKLSASHFKWEGLGVITCHWNPGDEDLLPPMLLRASQDPGLDDLVLQIRNNQSGAIGEAISEAKVSQ